MAHSRWAPAVLALSVAVLAGCTSSETGPTAAWTATLERNGIELTVGGLAGLRR